MSSPTLIFSQASFRVIDIFSQFITEYADEMIDITPMIPAHLLPSKSN